MKLTNILAILGALGVLGMIFVAGCTSKPADGAPQTSESPVGDSTSTKDDTADMGTTVAYTNDKGELLCPVLGDVISSADKAVGHQDYKGKRYYFCCAGCPEKFAADPDQYAK